MRAVEKRRSGWASRWREPGASCQWQCAASVAVVQCVSVGSVHRFFDSELRNVRLGYEELHLVASGFVW